MRMERFGGRRFLEKNTETGGTGGFHFLNVNSVYGSGL